MKKLLLIGVLTFFSFFPTQDTPVTHAQQGDSNEMCCCKYRVDGQEHFYWTTKSQCSKLRGHWVMFKPAGPGSSPEAMCRGLRGGR